MQKDSDHDKAYARAFVVRNLYTTRIAALYRPRRAVPRAEGIVLRVQSASRYVHNKIIIISKSKTHNPALPPKRYPWHASAGGLRVFIRPFRQRRISNGARRIKPKQHVSPARNHVSYNHYYVYTGINIRVTVVRIIILLTVYAC